MCREDKPAVISALSLILIYLLQLSDTSLHVHVHVGSFVHNYIFSIEKMNRLSRRNVYRPYFTAVEFRG